MNFENKNFIAAILLSMAIIFGWQYFYAAPLQKKLTAETQTAQTQQGTTAPSAPAAGGAVPSLPPEALAGDRAAAIAASPRLASNGRGPGRGRDAQHVAAGPGNTSGSN